MSYEQNLGRVKGDAGTTYIPRIQKKEDGKLYISYTSNDGTPIPPELEEKELSSYVYKPYVDPDTKKITFTLTDTASLNPKDDILDFGSIKGDTGNSTIGTKTVPEEPVFDDLPPEEKQMIREGRSLIYVIDTGEAYLDSGVFENTVDSNKNPIIKFVYFEEKLRFDRYYTKDETYNKNELYSRNEIHTQLGNIVEQQNAIIRILGDTDSIIILDDE